MVIVGASGHAKEVFDICENTENVYFFDNVTGFEHPVLFDKKILQSFEQLNEITSDKNFILGLGGVSG